MKYMKIITLWISMVYFGVSFVNAQSPGMACCGDVEYNPQSEACCPNGDKVVYGWGEYWIGEWCKDCTFVLSSYEAQNCCNSISGSVDFRMTVTVVCYNGRQSDCIGIDWSEFSVKCVGAILNGDWRSLCETLGEATLETLTRETYCSTKVCPDFECL